MSEQPTRSGPKSARRQNRRRETLENDPRWADHRARRAEDDAERELEVERSELFGRLAAGEADDVDRWCARVDRYCFYR